MNNIIYIIIAIIQPTIGINLSMNNTNVNTAKNMNKYKNINTPTTHPKNRADKNVNNPVNKLDNIN